MTAKKFTNRMLVTLGILLVGAIGDAIAQEKSNESSMKVFVDCSDCDLDYMKQNVAFVHYVHDRKSADLHVFVTSQASGGGTKYQFRFIGLGAYAGRDHTMIFASSSTDTADELRQKLTRSFVFGLLPYIAETKTAEQIKVTYAETGKSASVGTNDPWNYWTFSASTYGSMRGEATNSSRWNYESISAWRTTENWKINFGTDGMYRRRRYDLPDSSRVVSVEQSYSATSSAIKSMGEHWGVGSGVTWERDKFYNLQPSYKFTGAMEYNVFPYAQSSDRVCTLTYRVGLVDLHYEEQTIFGKTRETPFTQGIDVSFVTKRPWGDASVSTQLLQLGNPHTGRLVLRGDTSWRIVRGLSVNLNGSARIIRDQIYLPAGGLTIEEILLQQRAQATGFDYSLGMGFTFKFGSIYNSVVNTRLDRISFGIF